jgi:hypothetical protein
MADKSTKNLEESETVTLLLEVLFEKCEPEFEWDISEPYIYSDHPDHGGGRIQRDIEGVTFIGAGDLSRSEFIVIFGKAFVIAIENHAIENYEKYCSEEL